MDKERCEKQHAHMGHRWLIQQKKGEGAQQHWVDNLLHQDRTKINRNFLGEVEHGKILWAEMLGLSGSHLFPQAVAEFYKAEQWSSTLCCNNKRALELSLHHRRRIRPSAKCADIQQNLCIIKQTFTGNFKYFHIYGHMEKKADEVEEITKKKATKEVDKLNKQTKLLLGFQQELQLNDSNKILNEPDKCLQEYIC
jgi:hypothetical protein